MPRIKARSIIVTGGLLAAIAYAGDRLNIAENVHHTYVTMTSSTTGEACQSYLSHLQRATDTDAYQPQIERVIRESYIRLTPDTQMRASRDLFLSLSPDDQLLLVADIMKNSQFVMPESAAPLQDQANKFGKQAYDFLIGLEQRGREYFRGAQ
ncbi:hypothetical protein J4460_01050 [Candidatus Woesearchaeota archaeon]|nr:MAG: hypothetical protein QS99_C0001G0027 [archaeon GW2011_AR4]MBS3129238.1 hypothetical protein [Candidatus Woesearchaeota archaeon]HIH38541.1 hypothetical protein [Candidatus Woesearchaeota archaeon]HIH48496.1 hypothetical protein [Candidatus Woesearchaeota archaeon]HIJ02745.1 hypothetical protein [Candidatus Woesearchaeota archaeon]